jgi:hypothetical protein
MRKLKLDPERLEVESFEAPPSGAARGTVRARAWTRDAGEQTCARTCADSVDVMCDATFCDPGCMF